MRWLLGMSLLLLSCQKGAADKQPVPTVNQPEVAVVAPMGKTVDAASPPSPAIADDSVYQLAMTFVDQDGQTRTLASFLGKPTIVSMFYAHCPNACPLLIHKIQSLEGKLTEAERKQLQVLLVSFAPDVDTNSVLKALAKKQEVDETRWRLVRTNESSVRELSAVLGISYRKLDDGNYNHASVLTLLDRNGVMVAKLDGLGSPTETILQAMKQQTAGKSAQPGDAR